jgi:glycine/D-amino acid oxidase-like deaminating enzyme
VAASSARSLRVTVVGAGAFGGWTALELVRRGVRVTLIDAWGAGHQRASSGGETRVIRATYGSRAIYTRLALRALELWRAHDARARTSLFTQTGVLWLLGDDDGFGQASAAALARCGAVLQPVTLADARQRYPHIDFTGLASVLFEPDAGYLLARRACREVAAAVKAEGGTYRIAAAASPVAIDDAAKGRVVLTDGSTIESDAVVFACGPWLPALFPDLLGPVLTATRQEVYYFGAPAGDPRFTDGSLPVWIDLSGRQIYGIPSGPGGFKIADDTTGPPIDPTTSDRAPTPAGIDAARAFLGRRFPALASAPLVAAEVCQYESSIDAGFVIDRHPTAPDVWVAGGGSGHGYKMGPAVGELIAALVLSGRETEPAFGLDRFRATPAGGWETRWS